MKTVLVACSPLAVWGIAAFAADNPKGSPVAAQLAHRSLVDAGSPIRIQRAMARARRGEPVTVGVIGGSITQGARASRAELRWGEQVGAWWRERFPKSKVSFVNAGIGATGSNLGAHRIQAHLLAAKPDFVVAEYAVNDPSTPLAAETLEGVVRQVLKSDRSPGMMLLFTMAKGGRNAQAQHAPVGKHYGLPMVSFRDAMWPEIEAKRLKWEEILADEVHPNDPGHKLCADFVTAVLEKLLADLPDDAALPPVPAVPAPLHTDLFEFTTMHNAETLAPATNQGWTRNDKGPFGPVWQADKPGSVLEYQIAGEQITLIFHRIRKDMGRIRVTLDELPPRVFDAWFPGTWGGYSARGVLPRVPAGKHRLRLELLPEKAVESSGTHFEFRALLVAGGATPRPTRNVE
ncbi:MAG: SGNH/GDSL hydrolase family protein [Victivallales bacterium]|nr:SGNH/GDSL hydrolase family protein [Victivallales bacterium]